MEPSARSSQAELIIFAFWGLVCTPALDKDVLEGDARHRRD